MMQQRPGVRTGLNVMVFTVKDGISGSSTSSTFGDSSVAFLASLPWL